MVSNLITKLVLVGLMLLLKVILFILMLERILFMLLMILIRYGKEMELVNQTSKEPLGKEFLVLWFNSVFTELKFLGL
jgi:hypothetical protein